METKSALFTDRFEFGIQPRLVLGIQSKLKAMLIICSEDDFTMVKGPNKTQRFPTQLRRNPQALHVRNWHVFREKMGKPKAMLSPTRGEPLTLQRYSALIDDYKKRATKHHQQTRQGMGPLERIMKRRLGETIATKRAGYTIANEIIKDFGGTKGLSVFGFGVGYGQLLFFLRNFMGAKVKGVELKDFSKKFTKGRRLGIEYGKSAGDASLTEHGKFDATYSINVFETDIIDKDTALDMLSNIAALTRKGGKSYHIISFEHHVPFPKEEIEVIGEALGLKIDKWEKTPNRELFIKFTKTND